MNIMPLFYFLALITAAFVFWRRVREEHFDDYQLFDYFLSSLLLSWLLSRIGYIALNFDQFGFSLLNWVDIFAKPGFSLFLLNFFWGLLLFRSAAKHTNNSFAVLDFWVSALSAAAVWIFLGWLITGTHFGNETSLPIGLQPPGVFDKYHPTQLYSALFYFILSIYLSKLEYVYRTFSWYKGSRGTAQTGFLVGVFLLASGVWGLLLNFLKPGEIIVRGVAIDMFLAILSIVLAVVLLIARSGKFQKASASSTHDKKLQAPQF